MGVIRQGQDFKIKTFPAYPCLRFSYLCKYPTSFQIFSFLLKIIKCVTSVQFCLQSCQISNFAIQYILKKTLHTKITKTRSLLPNGTSNQHCEAV